MAAALASVALGSSFLTFLQVSVLTMQVAPVLYLCAHLASAAKQLRHRQMVVDQINERPGMGTYSPSTKPDLPFLLAPYREPC